MTTEQQQDIVFLDHPEIVEAEAVVDVEVVPPQGEPCGACGAPVEPGDKFCTDCGMAVETPNRPVDAEVVDEGPKKYIECKSCGAHIKTDPDQRSYTCPFCDSKYVVEYTSQDTGRQSPEFVIGFAVTPEQAMEKFRKWLKENSLFRPGDLAQARIEKKMRGVYLPFWRFTMLARSQWSASIGEYWWKTETYTTTDSKGRTRTRTRRVRRTEWWDLRGRHHLYHRDYLVSGSKGLPQREADRIKPFNLPALKRYEPYYIAGWVTEEYSIDRAEALEICRQEFYRREKAAVAGLLPGDTHNNLRVSTRFSRETSDLCLLPMYLLSYRYQEKVYRFMVNGQTGKIAGDKPWSWRRIGVAIGIGVALLAVIVLIILIVAGVLGGNA